MLQRLIVVMIIKETNIDNIGNKQEMNSDLVRKQKLFLDILPQNQTCFFKKNKKQNYPLMVGLEVDILPKGTSAVVATLMEKSHLFSPPTVFFFFLSQ